MGTLTRGQISKKNFEVGPEVVQPGPELVQPGPEVVQVGPLLVHSNISSTDILRANVRCWQIKNELLVFDFDNLWDKRGNSQVKLCYYSVRSDPNHTKL